MTKISIIIPNYNGQELLERNLPLVVDSLGSFIDQTEIIIIDDGSTDESVEYIKNQKFPLRPDLVGATGGQAKLKSCLSVSRNTEQKLKILENKKNYGFGYSCNRGVKEARGEIMVLLNNDVIPQKGFLSFLLPHFNDDSVFAVGCKELNGEERGRGVGIFKQGFLVHQRADNQNKKTTLWVSGGSGAFKKSIFEKLGGFDEIYKPFYWEDIDLSYRALKSGYRVLFEPKSIIHHRHETTIGRFFDKSYIETISYRNSFIFVWKNITDKTLICNHLFWLPLNLIKAIFSGNKAFINGFCKTIPLLPKVLKNRLVNKKLFTKGDQEVLQGSFSNI